MKSFPQPLTAAEEKYYMQKYTEGDLEAKHILIERNLRLVAHIVKKYQPPPEEMEDLLSIGTIGLMKAVVTFDPDKSARLASYAARCIENEVLMYLRGKKKSSKEVCKSFILPGENEPEGRLVKGIEILPADNLEELCAYLNGAAHSEKSKREKKENEKNRQHRAREDFADICGQKAVKRAAEIAVAGGHNLLMAGSPGSGKTMIAKRIATILPELSWEESLEITKIYSVLGLVDQEYPLITQRPFRNVHHTITRTALTGGGRIPMPGEISMAHGGVLFLDELAEFPRNVLEVLRQPLEEHQIHIARNYGNFTFPAEFMLVAAMNPCPCGNYPDVQKCSCTPGQIQKYLGKISQPFLDRMDICIETPKVVYRDLDGERKDLEGEETSETIRRRVTDARNIQRERYKGTDIRTNAVLGPQEIGHYVELGERERKMMELAFERIGLTARTYHKILRVARTIADLDYSEKVKEKHLKEAIAYRSLDKKYWGR